jgi:hypothetical protein
MLSDAGAREGAGTLRVLALPRRATVGDLRAAAGAATLAARRVLVNTLPRDDLCASARDDAPLDLATGDVIELLPDAPPAARPDASARAIAAERQRLMRIVGLAPTFSEWDARTALSARG